MLRATVLLGLLSTTALAADPLQALIFAGGATPADAQAALAAYKANLSNQLGNVVLLPAGEPRIVESAQLPGLKPGFHIVTLGLCKDASEALSAIKAFYPGAYVRPLTGDVGPERCPTIATDRDVSAVESTVKVGGLVLNAFVSGESSTDEREHDTSSSTVGVVLVEKRTGLVKDLVTTDGASIGASGDGPAGREYATCTAQVTAEKSGFLVTRSCTDERTGCAPGEKSIPKAWTETVRITVQGEKLAASEPKRSVTSSTKCVRGGYGD